MKDCCKTEEPPPKRWTRHLWKGVLALCALPLVAGAVIGSCNPPAEVEAHK